ncbi:MAG: hypothetical protein KHY36_04220 [Subdoligranulum variabile]|uniref:Uncharacterized protein n=1 Tax=Subdoligranulum variabile TaxID=214851 RepID=A0A943D7T6_9FIRM|nr:hypothetical protein [Subdoligranulum variabile]
MNYRLKNTNGKVTFLLRTGKDLVKNQMAIASAQYIIDHGKLLKSDVSGYPINIDNKWYFEGEVSKRTAPRKAEGEE